MYSCRVESSLVTMRSTLMPLKQQQRVCQAIQVAKGPASP
jgi:hypothetical protein